MDSTSHQTPTTEAILFFDGVCGLCNRFVDFVLRRDRGGRLRVAPLQGKTAERLLSEREVQDLRSVVFWQDGQISYRSDAVQQILRLLGGRWRAVAFILGMIPRQLRDFGYACVARYRYQWFGRRESCRLPSDEERQRFLP